MNRAANTLITILSLIETPYNPYSAVDYAYRLGLIDADERYGCHNYLDCYGVPLGINVMGITI